MDAGAAVSVKLRASRRERRWMKTETHEDKLKPNLNKVSVLEEKLTPFISKINTHLAQQ